ncbi:hypothetical protein [Brevibacterium litoralis]|uniref:hypothetical protein n=1 Tax=Brevibacterium litoralis TaxID=3138935 RepID=UPI0032EEA29A
MGLKDALSRREEKSRPDLTAAEATAGTFSAMRTGPGRLLAALYGFFTLAAGMRSVVQIPRDFDQAPVALTLSGIAAAVYLVATVCLVVSTRITHHVAVASCVFEFVGVVVVGFLSLTHPEMFRVDSVWSLFGIGYGFVPLVLPVLGLWWLRHVSRTVRASA